MVFEEIVARAIERYGTSLFAYCWMTNHVHLAIRVVEAPPQSNCAGRQIEWCRERLAGGRAANLSQIARYLNRAPSTISDLLHGRR